MLIPSKHTLPQLKLSLLNAQFIFKHIFAFGNIYFVLISTFKIKGILV